VGTGTLEILNSRKEVELPEPEMVEKDGDGQVTIFKAGAGGQILSSLTDRQQQVHQTNTAALR
jgi:hypothetical protein